MILPGTGRGTMRSMVEGTCGKGRRLRKPPSVIATRCHLPVPGRIASLTPRAYRSIRDRFPSGIKREWGVTPRLPLQL